MTIFERLNEIHLIGLTTKTQRNHMAIILKEIKETDKWRIDTLKTAEAIVNDRPYTGLKRLAKEFIVQRLIEDGLRGQ